MANTKARKITYDGKPVQVESAIRDSTGKVINTTYETIAQAVEYFEYTENVSTSQEYPKSIASMGFTSNKVPRIVQVFRPVTNTISNVVEMREILTDTYITPTDVVIYPTPAVNPQETWTVRVTAW